MNLLSSLLSLGRVLSNDIQLSHHGARLGWLTLMHYRGRWQQRRRATPTQISTALQVNGKQVRICLTPSHLGAVLGLFVDGEYDLRALLPDFKPTRILDLGANAGMGAAYLHAIYRDATFVCVEPDPRNLPLLKETLAANQINATEIAAAIGPVSGQLNLRFGDDPTCSALENSPMHNLANVVPVQVVTISEVMAHVGWDRIDLVKIDIEGSEKDLLSTNNEWMNQVETLVLEIHPNTSPEEIQEYLNPFGFKLTRTNSATREPVYLARRS